MYFNHSYLRNKFVKTTTIGIVYSLGAFMYSSFFTPYLEQLGWTSELIGIFFSLFAFMGFFFAPLIGALSDSIGRYRMIMIGIGIEIIAIAGYVFFSSVPLLLFLRLVSSFSYNAVIVSALARVEDSIDKEDKRSRLSGFYQSGQAIAVLLAPLLGGILADAYGYTNMFLAAGGIMIILLLGMLVYDKFKFSEDYPHRKRPDFAVKDFNPLQSIKKVMKIPELRSICVLGFASNLYAPFRHLIIPLLVVQEFGFSNVALSYILLIFGFAHLFQFYTGYLADKYSPELFIFWGNVAFVIVAILLIFVNSYAFLFAVVVLHAIAGTFWNVSAWSYMSKYGKKYKLEGHVIGAYMALAHKAHTISFIVCGFLLVYGFAPVYLFFAGAIVIGLFLSRKHFMNIALQKS